MSDVQPGANSPQPPPANVPSGEDDWLPERSFWQLLPKRTLLRAFWLLLLLVGVIWFRSRSASCAATFTQAISPVPPVAPLETRPRVRGEEGRTVRLAPLVDSGPTQSPAPSSGRPTP